MLRPRELIEYFNDCIELADGSPTITAEIIITAEGVYSRSRLHSLQDEWFGDYPHLERYAELLRRKPQSLRVSDLDEERVLQVCFDTATAGGQQQDRLRDEARQFVEGDIGLERICASIVFVLYKTGIVGLKTSPVEPHQWTFSGIAEVTADSIAEDTSMEVHPMFYRALETTLKPAR